MGELLNKQEPNGDFGLNVTTGYAFETTATVLPTTLPFSNVYYWTVCILAPAALVIILFGIISNVTNIVVFLKCGLKDNVTTLLFSLAVSDLIFLVLCTLTTCSLVVLNFEKSWSWPFDPMFLFFLPYWPSYTVYDISAFISVSLGVTRCACVTMPLKFKSVFTKRRTVIIVLVLAVLAVSLRIPVLTIFRVAWRKDPVTNVTSAYLAAVNKVAMFRINDIFNRGIVVVINYVVMISCVGLLSYKLSEASRIRRSYKANGDLTSDKTVKDALSPKDLQVVKSVVLVCVIFILSQLPFLLYSTARLINPELTSSGRMLHLFAVYSQISVTFSYLNASMNIFVYYNYNSKYRSVFLSVLPSKNKALKALKKHQY